MGCFFNERAALFKDAVNSALYSRHHCHLSLSGLSLGGVGWVLWRFYWTRDWRCFTYTLITIAHCCYFMWVSPCDVNWHLPAASGLPWEAGLTQNMSWCQMEGGCCLGSPLACCCRRCLLYPWATWHRLLGGMLPSWHPRNFGGHMKPLYSDINVCMKNKSREGISHSFMALKSGSTNQLERIDSQLCYYH